MASRLHCGLTVLVFVLGGFLLPSFGQVPENLPAPGATEHETADAGGALSADPILPGTISGTVVDGSGAVVEAAHVKLIREDHSVPQEILSGDDGQFSFSNIAPGPFHLTFTLAGFAPQTFSAIVRSGQTYIVPKVTLAVADNVTEVQVGISPVEVAEEEIKEQEKQRMFGVLPNFYVTYVRDAAPLNSKQKFALAWKTTIDPVTLGVVGVTAGIQQSQNAFSGYGQGTQGYAKRFGASTGDLFAGTFIGAAMLPSLLKQDPRYFYKGSGSKSSRLLYALANAVICKGDNGRWQPNYSNVLGNLAAGGISNLYYPASDRNGAALTFETGLIGIGTTAVVNVLQEFVIRKLTSNVPKQDSVKP